MKFRRSGLPNATHRLEPQSGPIRLRASCAWPALLFLAVGVSIACASSRGSAQDCSRNGWSLPTALSAGGVTRLRTPVIVSAAGHTYIVGNRDSETLPGPTNDHELEPLVVWRLAHESGKPIVADAGRPPGAHRITLAAAGVDRRGQLHILWVEPPVAQGASHQAVGVASPPPVALWHAMYTRDHWSKPAQIATLQRATWNPSARSPMTPASDGGLLIAFPAERGDSGVVAIVHLAADGPTSLRVVPSGGQLEPAYAAVAESRGEFIVAYIAGIAGEHDVNSVFSVVSESRARRWSSSVVVSRSGRRPAANPVLLTTPQGVKLVWLQQTSDSPDRQAVRYASSANLGRSWTAVHTLPLDDAASVHRCGRSGLLIERGSLRQSSLWAVNLHRSPVMEPLFSEFLSYSPSTAVDARGCTMILWTAARRDSTHFDADRIPPLPVLRYSRKCAFTQTTNSSAH
jgi:hypothetical protein